MLNTAIYNNDASKFERCNSLQLTGLVCGVGLQKCSCHQGGEPNGFQEHTSFHAFIKTACEHLEHVQTCNVGVLCNVDDV